MIDATFLKADICLHVVGGDIIIIIVCRSIDQPVRDDAIELKSASLSRPSRAASGQGGDSVECGKCWVQAVPMSRKASWNRSKDTKDSSVSDLKKCFFNNRCWKSRDKK